MSTDPTADAPRPTDSKQETCQDKRLFALYVALLPEVHKERNEFLVRYDGEGTYPLTEVHETALARAVAALDFFRERVWAGEFPEDRS